MAEITLAFGDVQNGRISYTLQAESDTVPSPLTKPDEGTTYTRYTSTPGGTVDYAPGSTASAGYQYQIGTVQKKLNQNGGIYTGWTILEDHIGTWIEANARAMVYISEEADYQTRCILIEANEVTTSRYQVVKKSYALAVSWGEELSGTVSGVIPERDRPEPELRVIPAVSETEVRFIVSGIPDGSTVTIWVTGGSAAYDYSYSRWKTLDADGLVIFTGLLSGLSHSYSIYLDSALRGSGSFTTAGEAPERIPPEIGWVSYSYEYHLIEVGVVRTIANETAAVTYTCPGVDVTKELLCSATSTVVLLEEQIYPNRTYAITVTLDGYTLQTSIYTAHDEVFAWDTPIAAGAPMPYETDGHSGHVFPVTANEWNRFIQLLNSKTGQSLPYAAIYETMDASAAGNVGRAASALGVPIPPGGKITAAFFCALADALNAL